MSYFHTCPHCGANLDPGESCADCREKEEAAQGAANTQDGEAEQIKPAVSASIVHKNEEDCQYGT